ncbi:MAG: UDP-N-acetylglucosamine 1-carboxyvinyltransferase [Eubacteriales bacterium]|nr:UDP-N-acetylglucosamine 1-carboxyvinyltransferase [Eubacteriales bacterium]
MRDIRIVGGRPLHGSISIQGSKNAALPMMAASLLHRGVSVLKGCPRIADVFCMEEILRELGAVTWWEDHDLYMDCTLADKTEISGIYTGKMRSSVILLGAMLGRSRKGRLGYPGGCVIGERPIDLHLYALRQLGADIEEGPFLISASCDRLTGGEISFAKCSVGATEQGILAAVLARGDTCLKNCAREPEIQWLCRYLRTMGACIEGEGSDCIRITGVEGLEHGEMEVPPDRIVAGTYICAAAATRGTIIIENPPVDELDAFLEVYRKMGGQYKLKSGKLIADSSGIGYPLSFLETEVYPGFPTDLQSPVMAVLTTISGESYIREQIFEDRYKAAVELNRMGADITVEGRDARIIGGSSLRGCTVTAQELRGGAALVLAALAAEGVTRVQGYQYIRRGYEHICEDLNTLGGMLEKDTGIRLYESIQLPKKLIN